MNVDMKKIHQVKTQSLELLNSSRSEWSGVYANYAHSILKNIKSIKELKSKFKQWSPLYLYSTVGMAMGNANKFQLRFMGQIVAVLCVKRDSVFLSTYDGSTDYAASNWKWFKYGTTHDEVEWRSAEATSFRRYFSDILNKYRPKQLEHKIESMVLTEMEKRNKKSKFLGTFSGIQPVKIANALRFQMKTPFGASQKNVLKYVGKYGGGIDILARCGLGASTLSVIELKEPNIVFQQPVIEQGLAYCLFLRELLRSKSGADWYNIFGYSGDKPPHRLVLNCIAMMGGKTQTPCFGNNIIKVENDEIHLHHVFYEECNDGIAVTETSLR